MIFILLLISCESVHQILFGTLRPNSFNLQVSQNLLRFTYLQPSKGFPDQYFLSHIDDRKIKHAARDLHILLQPGNCQLDFQRCYFRSLRDKGFDVKATPFLKALTELADANGMSMIGYDGSDLKFPFLFKYGQTFYERFGFRYVQELPKWTRDLYDTKVNGERIRDRVERIEKSYEFLTDLHIQRMCLESGISQKDVKAFLMTQDWTMRYNGQRGANDLREIKRSNIVKNQ